MSANRCLKTIRPISNSHAGVTCRMVEHTNFLKETDYSEIPRHCIPSTTDYPLAEANSGLMADMA